LYRLKTTAPARATTNVKVIRGRRLTNAIGFIAAILFISLRLDSVPLPLGQGTAMSMGGIQRGKVITLDATPEQGDGAWEGEF
jgi:hypothetical protein